MFANLLGEMNYNIVRVFSEFFGCIRVMQVLAFFVISAYNVNAQDLKESGNFQAKNLILVQQDKVTDLISLIKQEMNHLDFSVSGAGCEARAHEIAYYLESKGFDSAKIFMEGNGIKIRAWKFHVAVAIRIFEGADEKSFVVIDPGLADQPITIEQWKELATVGRSKEVYTYFTSRFTYIPLQLGGIDRSNWIPEELHEACRTNQDLALYIQSAKENNLKRYYEILRSRDWWQGKSAPSYCTKLLKS